MWVHWKLERDAPGGAGVRLAAEATGTGYVAMGWGSEMVGSEVVIGLPSEVNASLQLFFILYFLSNVFQRNPLLTVLGPEGK